MVTDKQATLEWLNGKLEEWGWPTLETMPKGIRKQPDRCPIACAIPGAQVGARRMFLSDGEVVHLPPPVRRFVESFDAGDYPELQLRYRDIRPSRVAIPA